MADGGELSKAEESFVNSWFLAVRGYCDEACLELLFDPFPKQTVFTVLQMIGSKPITYDNALPSNNRALISEMQVNYMEDIIVKRDTEKLEMSRNKAIQVISDTGQSNPFVQLDKNLEYLIWVKHLPHLKRLVQVVKSQAKNTKQSHICVSKQYCWHMTIEAKWEDLRHENLPCDFFIRYDHIFQLNLDETCFLFNGGEFRIIGGNDKTHHNKQCSDLRFTISVLQVGSESGVNGPVIFLANGEKVHPKLRSKDLVTRYGLP